MQYKVISSEKVYRGRAFNVRRDQIRFPGGNLTQRDIVEHAPAVTLVPIDNDGQVCFIRQYRHPINAYLLELPAGVIEEGETPLVTAQREIREEIGMAAQSMQQIGEFYLAPGYSTEYMYVYLAQGLYPSPLPADDDEEITIEKIPLEFVINMDNVNQLKDGKTLASLLVALPFLKTLEG